MLYALGLYGLLLLALALGGAGHGLIWPAFVWLILALPGSLVGVVSYFMFDEGPAEVAFVVCLAAAPILNILLWLWWNRRRTREGR